MKRTALFLCLFTTLAAAGGAETAKVRIGYPTGGALINAQVGLILERTNILELNALDAEVVPFLNGPPMQEALLAGYLDIALTSDANFVNLLSKFPCKVIAGMGSAGRIAMMVGQDSPYKSVAQLKGKTVTTVFGASAHYPAAQWLLKAGLTPGKDVKLVNMGNSEARLALIKGDIDAVVLGDPFVADFVEKKTGRILAFDPAFWTTTVASEKFLAERPGDAVKFLAALHEAVLFMAGNKDLVNGWLSKTMNVAPAIIDKGSTYNDNYSKAKKLKDVKLVPGAEVTGRLEKIAELDIQAGLLKVKPPVTEKTDSSFVKAAREKVLAMKYDPASVIVKGSAGADEKE